MDKEEIKRILLELDHVAFECQQERVRRRDKSGACEYLKYREALCDVAKNLEIDCSLEQKACFQSDMLNSIELASIKNID